MTSRSGGRSDARGITRDDAGHRGSRGGQQPGAEVEAGAYGGRERPDVGLLYPADHFDYRILNSGTGLIKPRFI